MRSIFKCWFLSLLVLGVISQPGDCFSEVLKVSNVSELRSSLETVSAGAVIEIEAGRYDRGFRLSNLHGRSDAPIVITGSDPENPPIFEGLGEGLKVSNCSYIKFKNIIFTGFPTNGINVDDGGNLENPSHHIILENITILDTGAKGNHDALKMSGVDHFVVRNCRFSGWGGSGIDLVGCHNGVIEGCRFIGKEGFRGANSIQTKGGSRFILVQNNIFKDSGSRLLNLGGATGLQYFRPAIDNYEAKDIIVAGNTFIGGEAQIAWVTVQNSHVFNNLFYQPEKWLGRILQETKDRRFAPSQGGIFEKNLIVTNDIQVRTLFNIGRGTDPGSFVLRGNAWSTSKRMVDASLPVDEVDGIYQVAPDLIDESNGSFKAGSNDPWLKDVGPWNYVPVKFEKEFMNIDLPLVETPKISPSRPLGDLLLKEGAIFLVSSLGLASLGTVLLRPHYRKKRSSRRRKRR